MDWTPHIMLFISNHLQDDTAKLLLSAHRYPDVDVPFAVDQIEARRRLRLKLPEWYANPDLIMGGRVPAEQCSSESTARYKRTLLEGYHSLCDMTGGMGVDFWYMSRGLRLAIYTECQTRLCQVARHNFKVLSRTEAEACPNALLPELQVREGLSTELPIPDVDVIYLDPARRSDVGSRIYEIEDCMPNVIAWQDELLQHCKRLITKVSPMADIHRALLRLKGVAELHVVSVRNECKELLIVQQSSTADVGRPASSGSIRVRCLDFLTDKTLCFSFDWTGSSTSADVPLVPNLSFACYLYEPDVSLMKAQAFAALAAQFPVQMLDVNTHLFVSEEFVPEFPGRSFVIDKVMEFSSRQLKQLRRCIPQANITTRNFPLTPDEMRVRTGIRDGGSVYLFGGMVAGLGHRLFVCHKCADSELLS